MCHKNFDLSSLDLLKKYVVLFIFNATQILKNQITLEKSEKIFLQHAK